MNSTMVSNSGGFLGSDKIGAFGYGIGVSIGILLLITTLTLVSYYCIDRRRPSHQSWERHEQGSHTADTDIESGIDEATLSSYPKLLYSRARLQNKDSTASCCSICLADYKDTDILRMLPECGHLFHLKCVDGWLRLNPTCPVCRTTPLPTPGSTPLQTPISTPLAEVVPLARA